MTLLDQVIAAFTRDSGPDSPDTLIALTNLGVCYTKQGEWLSAPLCPVLFHSSISRRAVAIVSSLFQDELSLGVSCLLIDWQCMGADDSLFVVAPPACVRVHPPGKDTEALAIDERVYTASKRVNGPEHPDTLEYGTNLACSFTQLERHAEAEDLLRQTLASFAQIYPNDYPQVGDSAVQSSVSYLFYLGDPRWRSMRPLTHQDG